MTRKRLWMNRISGIVCLLLWIAFIIFLSGTTGKIAGMALGIMLLVAVIYNLYLPKEVSTHLIIPAYAQKEEKLPDDFLSAIQECSLFYLGKFFYR